jgi:hypothetical protein
MLYLVLAFGTPFLLWVAWRLFILAAKLVGITATVILYILSPRFRHFCATGELLQ